MVTYCNNIDVEKPWVSFWKWSTSGFSSMLVYRRGNSNYIILHPIRYPKIFPRKPMENSHSCHSCFVSSNGWQVRPPLAALHWPSQRAPTPWTPLGFQGDGLNMENPPGGTAKSSSDVYYYYNVRPPSYKLVNKSPSNYSYKYHKP